MLLSCKLHLTLCQGLWSMLDVIMLVQQAIWVDENFIILLNKVTFTRMWFSYFSNWCKFLFMYYQKKADN